MALSVKIGLPSVSKLSHHNYHYNYRRSPVASLRSFTLMHHDTATSHNFSKPEGSRPSVQCPSNCRRLRREGGSHRGGQIVVAARASSARIDDGSLSYSQRKLKTLIAAAITVGFAVANRVLYKLALVPMKEYPFFLAQLTTFGYVVVYFSILYFRYHAGIVTDEMLAFPKLHFVVIGALEALGVASGMTAAVNLSGASIPILSQTFLVWQLILSVLILGRRYAVNQIFGCLLVAVGVIMAIASEASTGQLLENAGYFWPLLMIVSSSFQAGASILKESVFLDAAKRLKSGSVDIFVVNSFGSGFQALFVLLLLPFLSKLKGILFNQLPSYFKDAAVCFINMGSISKDCAGAPLLPLLFIIVNMCFNISLLRLVKMSSAVVASLSITLAVPLSIFVFTLPLPYLGAESRLTPIFILGATILVLGLVIYNLPNNSKDALKKL